MTNENRANRCAYDLSLSMPHDNRKKVILDFLNAATAERDALLKDAYEIMLNSTFANKGDARRAVAWMDKYKENA